MRRGADFMRPTRIPSASETGTEMPIHAARASQRFTGTSFPLLADLEHHPTGPFLTSHWDVDVPWPDEPDRTNRPDGELARQPLGHEAVEAQLGLLGFDPG